MIKNNNFKHNKIITLLSLNCFKKICMRANTVEGDKITEYYIKIENGIKNIIKENYDKSQKLLEEAQERIKLIEERPDFKHNINNDTTGDMYLATLRFKTHLKRIGESLDSILRDKNYKGSYIGQKSDVQLLSWEGINNQKLMEKLIHLVFSFYLIDEGRQTDRFFFECLSTDEVAKIMESFMKLFNPIFKNSTFEEHKKTLLKFSDIVDAVIDISDIENTIKIKVNNIENLEEVIEEKISRIIIYECDNCEFVTKSKIEYRKHMKEKHNIIDSKKYPWLYNCIECNYHTDENSHYNRHLKSNEHLKTIETYDNKNIVINTADIDNLSKMKNNYICDYCKFICTHKRRYRKHMKEKHKSLIKQNDYIEKYSYLHNCLQCNYHTDAISHYNDHINSISHKQKLEEKVDKLFKCEICNTTFLTNWSLTRHLKESKTHKNNLIKSKINIQN